MMTSLISGLARMTLVSTNLSPAVSVFQTTNRFLSITGCLGRKLDSHAHPPYMHPSSKHGRWVELKSFRERYEYTIKPLPFPKTGGRGPNGRIWNHRRGGGLKRVFHMIDWVRCSEPQGTKVEKVVKIMEDQNRSGRIALVADGDVQRYIIATENMKAGDIINSTQVISHSPVRPVEGDSHPLGSLPLGTLINCVETFPGTGGFMARSAGVTAQLVRKQDNMCVVRLPSKREILLHPTCTATIGRVSNVDHNKRVIGKAGRNRWLGIRPRSGRWHRKDGHAGRKIHGPRPPVVYTEKPKPKLNPTRFRVEKMGIFESRVFSR